MYAPNFDYHRASSLKQAHELLAAHAGAKLLAGGHSLIPMLKLRFAAPETVIDIGRIAELGGIKDGKDGLRIGALTTHGEIAASDAVRKGAPALAEAAALVGDPAVRNRGTIGGNVAHADPASDLPTVLVALGAHIAVSGAKGERTIPAEEFFLGMMTTALGEQEIVAAVVVPTAAKGQGSAYVKFAHPASRYAVIGVAASVTKQGGTIGEARVAIGGLVPHARLAKAVNGALAGSAGDDKAVAAAAAKVAGDVGDEAIGDIFASADYRKAVAPVYVQRAVAAALARA